MLKKTVVYINIFILTLFMAANVLVAVLYWPKITALASSPEKVSEVVTSFGPAGIFVFILHQIVRVVVAVIPGEIIQIAGGYIYGTLFGTIYSLIGIFTGYVAVFFISRTLGYPIVKAFVSDEKIKKFSFLMNSKRSETAMFVLFLIPGLPKDMFVYIAGITPVKPLRFFLLTALARLPAMVGSSFIGANFQEENYSIAFIVSAAAVVLFVLGIVYRDRIVEAIKTKNR